MIAADPLVLTILERPDDDAPRLVFADWLEEKGEPQAELIRLQCELARLAENDPRRNQLKSRQSELYATYNPLWFTPLQELGIIGRFRRGFLEVDVNGIGRLLDMAPGLFALPWVLHVNLADGAADRSALAALIDSPYFRRVRKLDLSRSCLANEGAYILARSPHPWRLTLLDLSGNQISTNGLRALTETVDLTYLSELRLSGNGIGPVGGRALAVSTQLTRLRVLDLQYNHLHTQGGIYLAEAVSLSHLQKLLVRSNRIGPDGERALRRRFGPRVQLGSLSSRN